MDAKLYYDTIINICHTPYAAYVTLEEDYDRLTLHCASPRKYCLR